MFDAMWRSAAQHARLGATTGLLCGLGLLFGCVSSERAEYSRHLDARVLPGPASDDDLAFAFGLDEYAANPLARLDDAP